MSINVADIVSEYGDYYLKSEQNMSRLTAQLFQPSVTAAYFSKRPTENTVMRFSHSTIERVLQPFQKQFTETGELKFLPNEIKLFRLKIDKEEYPDDITENWLGFLEGKGVSRKEWPFIRWFLEVHIFPKSREDLEMNEIFSGEFASPTPGTAGAAGTSMDGILKIQNDYIDDGRITPISMTKPSGQANDEDFCSDIEGFVEDIPALSRRKIDYVFMGEDLELRYRKGKRSKYNENYAQEPNLASIADFPNVKVIGLPSMNGSDRIWTSHPETRINALKKAPLASTMKVEESKRQVALYTDWYQGVGFQVPEFVFVNDQEIPEP